MTTYRPYAPSVRWSWLPALVLIGGFLVAPLAVITSQSLSTRGFLDVLTSPSMQGVWWFTLWQALVSTAATFLVALPATWVVSRFSFAGRRLLIATMTVPFLLPTVVVGAAFLALLPQSMHYTASAIIIAHAYFNIAVVVRVVGSTWQQLDPRLHEAARTLGARPFDVTRTITWPLLRTAATAAFGVIFLLCFTSYGVIRILGGPSLSTVETEIYLRAVVFGDTDGAVALSVLQMLVLLALLGVWGIRRNGSPSSTPTMHLRHATTTRDRRIVRSVTVVMATVTIAPLLAVALRSVRVRGHLSGAGWSALLSQGIADAVVTSLLYALVAALITGLVAIGATTAMSYGSRRMTVVSMLTSLPLTVSAVTVGLGILITFDTSPFEFRSSWFITPVAHSLIAVPLALRTIAPVARAVPPTYAHAAATLGAAPLTAWLTIDWPLLRRALASAGALAFAVSIGEFGATSFLTRRASETVPMAISRLLGRPGDVNQLTAYMLATLLIVMCVIVVAVIDNERPARG